MADMWSARILSLVPGLSTASEELQVSYIESVADDLTADDSTISAICSRFTDCASGGATLPPAIQGMSLTLRNDSADDLIVSPANGEQVNGSSSLTVPSATEATVRSFTSGQWWAAISN